MVEPQHDIPVVQVGHTPPRPCPIENKPMTSSPVCVCLCVRVYVFVSVSFSFGTSLQISQMGEFRPDDNQLIGFLCIFIKPIQSFILALAER